MRKPGAAAWVQTIMSNKNRERYESTVGQELRAQGVANPAQARYFEEADASQEPSTLLHMLACLDFSTSTNQDVNGEITQWFLPSTVLAAVLVTVVARGTGSVRNTRYAWGKPMMARSRFYRS